MTKKKCTNTVATASSGGVISLTECSQEVKSSTSCNTLTSIIGDRKLFSYGGSSSNECLCCQ